MKRAASRTKVDFYFFRTIPETARIKMTKRSPYLSLDCEVSLFAVMWLLTVYSLVVNLRITTFNIQKILHFVHTMYVSVWYGSQHKQRFFPYTTLVGYYNRRGP